MFHRPTAHRSFRAHMGRAVGRGLVVAGLLSAVMIHGTLTGSVDSVEWPTGSVDVRVAGV